MPAQTALKREAISGKTRTSSEQAKTDGINALKIELVAQLVEVPKSDDQSVQKNLFNLLSKFNCCVSYNFHRGGAVLPITLEEMAMTFELKDSSLLKAQAFINDEWVNGSIVFLTNTVCSKT